MGNLLASIDPDMIQPTPLGGLVFLAMVLVIVGGVVVAVIFIVRAVRTRGRWYPDPDGSDHFRWHNGQEWTHIYTDNPSRRPPETPR